MASDMKLTFALAISFILLLSFDGAFSQCLNYKILSNETRFIGYVDGTYSKCDSGLATGWYRFMGNAGSKLLDYNPGLKPNTFGCKTHAAGWLNGQHPSIADGEVSRTVCFIWWQNNNIGDPILNCKWSTSIKIRNCGSYFVYYLVPTPVCWLRYCGTGRRDTCSASQQCQNNGTCVYQHGGNQCKCTHDFTGQNCSKKNIPCDEKPCLNGGICRNVFGQNYTTFECNCLTGFRGRLCNESYGQNSTVLCSKNYMRIDLDRKYYDVSLYSSITLRNPSCTATYTAHYVTLGSVPGACGSVQKETSSHIVFENEVILTAKSANGMITRNYDEKVSFQCRYNKNGQVSSIGYKPMTSVNASEIGYGNFSFNFVMYKDRDFSQMHSHYPVSVKLRDWMYFEIYGSISSNIVLLIDQCYSTPTMDRNHYLKYIFINNRCPVDSTVSFHSTVSSRQRFSIQAFRYLNSSTAVYFHCLVFLCHTSSSDHRCRTGCHGNNIYRGKREVTTMSKDEPSKYYLLEMEVRKSKDDSGRQSGASKREMIGTVWIILGFAACACIMVGLAVRNRLLKKKVTVAPHDDQTKKGKQYAEMDVHNDSAQEPKETVIIEDPGAVADDLVMCKSKQADIFVEKVA